MSAKKNKSEKIADAIRKAEEIKSPEDELRRASAMVHLAYMYVKARRERDELRQQQGERP